jgi:hypothetical protein
MIQKPFAAYIRMRGFGGLMRRQLAAAFIVSVLGSTTVSAANDFPYGQTLAFNAYRNGQEIGRHTLSFQQDGPNRVVTVAINFGVKAMGITAYRYIHSDREVWNGDTLQALDSETDDNGKKYKVHVQRGANGLTVERQAPADAINASTADQGLQPPSIEREVLPADILPTSHWNIAQVKRSVLLNTQYGTQAHVRVTPMGREPVKTATGATIEATRYHYTGDIRMDQWFDDRGRWVKGMFTAPDGSTIDYVLQE